MPATVTTDVIIFDLDGTLVNTTPAVDIAFEKMCLKHNVDREVLGRLFHGLRSIEIFSTYFAHAGDAEELVTEFEGSIGRDYPDSVKLIVGARELLLSLTEYGSKVLTDDTRMWAICTSGTQPLAHSWFDHDHILKPVGKPSVFITAEDVKTGKPSPEGYLKAKKLLSDKLDLDTSASRSVVFEDAPVGVKAGVASGSIVIGILTSFTKQDLIDAGATYVVEDLSKVNVIGYDSNGVVLEVNHS